MKVSTTSERLKQLLSERKMRQVDILDAAKPYPEKYNVKLNKNDLSQYISGKTEPGQSKLSILGMALNVNEAWLMGYNVPMDRECSTTDISFLEEKEQFCKRHFPEHSKKIEHLLNDIDNLSNKGIDEACKRVHELTLIPEYSNSTPTITVRSAARSNDGSVAAGTTTITEEQLKKLQNAPTIKDL